MLPDFMKRAVIRQDGHTSGHPTGAVHIMATGKTPADCMYPRWDPFETGGPVLPPSGPRMSNMMSYIYVDLLDVTYSFEFLEEHKAVATLLQWTWFVADLFSGAHVIPLPPLQNPGIYI